MGEGLGGGGLAIVAGRPNWLAASSATIVAATGAQSAAMPGSNLKDGEPSNVARITTQSPHKSYFAGAIGEDREVSCVVAVNPSLVPGSMYRVVCSDNVGGGGSFAPVSTDQSLPPTAIVGTSTNFSGAVGDFDEDPEAPDGVWVGPSNPDLLTWAVRVEFATPAQAPATGSKWQTFSVWARVQGAYGGFTEWPQITVELWESGSLVASLGSKLVTSPTGQWLHFYWDAAPLAVGTGAGVEMKIIGTTNNDVPAAYAQVDAARWYSMSAASVALASLDTKWLTVPGIEQVSAWGDSSLADIGLRPRLLFHVFETPATVDRIAIAFRDDGVEFFEDFASTPAKPFNDFIDLGVLSAGPHYTLARNWLKGARLGTRTIVVGGGQSTLGGTAYAAAASVQRTIEGLQAVLPLEDTSQLYGRIDLSTAGVVPFFFHLAPGAFADLDQHVGLWVTAEAAGVSFGGEVLAGLAAEDKHSATVSYNLVEKL